MKTILFDLDGTIIDSAESITRSAQYALEKFGISVNDLKELYPFIGPPLVDSFMKFYGFSEQDAMLATQYYRDRYAVKGIYETKLYDGVEDMLRSVKNLGYKIAITTSKNEPHSIMILEYHKIASLFDTISGGNADGTCATKRDVVEKALKRLGVTDDERKNETWLVGDRIFDIEGARQCAVRPVGVSYGFAPQGELESLNPEFIAKSPEDITRYFKLQ